MVYVAFKIFTYIYPVHVRYMYKSLNTFRFLDAIVSVSFFRSTNASQFELVFTTTATLTTTDVRTVRPLLRNRTKSSRQTPVRPEICKEFLFGS